MTEPESYQSARAEVHLHCFQKAQTLDEFIRLMDAIETAAALPEFQKPDSHKNGTIQQTIRLIGRWRN